jgi:hypothetical protein
MPDGGTPFESPWQRPLQLAAAEFLSCRFAEEQVLQAVNTQLRCKTNRRRKRAQQMDKNQQTSEPHFKRLDKHMLSMPSGLKQQQAPVGLLALAVEPQSHEGKDGS